MTLTSADAWVDESDLLCVVQVHNSKHCMKQICSSKCKLLCAMAPMQVNRFAFPAPSSPAPHRLLCQRRGSYLPLYCSIIQRRSLLWRWSGTGGLGHPRSVGPIEGFMPSATTLYSKDMKDLYGLTGPANEKLRLRIRHVGIVKHPVRLRH